MASCKNDVTGAGRSVLDADDNIIVLADTFPLSSAIDSCESIISQADSFLLGEIETDYGLVRASIMTQLACPEGYSYPAGAVIDSVCLLMYYSSWVGDGYSPLAINVYLMDRATFSYNKSYPTNLNVSDFCSRDKSVLTNHRIIAAHEKFDSIQNSAGNYVPMVRLRLNDDFVNMFSAIRSFETQEKFNQQFKGLLLESSFGSSTMLNVSDIALGVFYHFSYSKAGRDTVVNDMKAFYANSEVRTVNHIKYTDKSEWVDNLQKDSATYNYIVAPAGVYTRMEFPMEQIVDSMCAKLAIDTLPDGTIRYKRPYVNLAQLKVQVTNVFSGTASSLKRNDWLQPAAYMLLVKESSMARFFDNKELPSDTCALLSSLQQGVDEQGNTIYYYSYDLEDFLTNQLRQDSLEAVLKMMLVPVTVSTGTSNANASAVVTSVKQQQTLSATQIRSASNGMNLKLVYSGF
ncbi:MAG: DUF4270 domain-containing protein [Paludibacteraceae bacterium]|nr:DUF4270 domain-containing protein [Paludibacteraceae bacterium]